MITEELQKSRFTGTPKISIVTPSFNQGRFIRDTIESVRNQNYSNWEHIVIDGGSKDDTINILKEYPQIKWVSEKDNGPSQALNKGFRMADGDIYAWINADDYFEKNIFGNIAELFSSENIDLLIGIVTFIYEKTGLKDRQLMNEINLNDLIHNTADSVRQAGVFFTGKLFKEVGGIDESLQLVFDYDLFIKMLKKGIKKCISNNFAYQRMYDETLTKRKLNTQAFEIFKVSRRYGARLTDLIMLKSVLRKFIFPSRY